MAVHYNSKIVTDDLKLCLDAGNTKSYPGSGTTWTDLSGNGNNGTLTNGPTYSSDNGGGISLDGINDYVQCPLVTSATSNITMMGFVKVTLNTKGTFFRNGGSTHGYSIGIGSVDFDNAGNNIIGLFANVRWAATTTPYDSGWQMITFILDGSSVLSGYKNTTSVTFPTGSAPAAPALNTYLGANIGDNTRYGQCIVGNFLFYTRALSAAEVQQNFNALRGRYGI